MKILRVLLFILIGIIALYLILSFIGPKKLEMERSIEVNASKERVFEHVNSLQDMEKWSPWSKMDADAEGQFEGEEGEIGSSYTWSGDTVGMGTQKITEIDAPNKVATRLEFGGDQPFKANAWIELDSLGPRKTEVVWGFSTDFSFWDRAAMLFFNLEDTLGSQYQQGLENLKEMVESNKMEMEQKRFEVKKYTIQNNKYMVQKDTVRFQNMTAQFQETGEAIHKAIENNDLSATGTLVALFYTWDTVNQKTYMAIGIPTTNMEAIEGFELIELDEQPALKIDHYGGYDESGAAHDYMAFYAEKNNIELESPAIERYVTDPTVEPDTSKWLTEIIYPVKRSTDE